MLAATLVFVAAYVLLSLPRVEVRGRRVTRPVIALLGGGAMVALGVVAPAAAVAAVDLATLALLLGMMLLVAALEVAGFFEILAASLVARARTPRGLLVAVMVAVAGLSALFLNDAVVLLVTPVLVRACGRTGASPMPYLCGAAVAANVGSVATPVGNPQNAYIAVAGGLGFAEFAATLLPVAAASLAVAVAMALVAFRRDLDARPRVPDEPVAVRHPVLLAATLLVAVATLVALVLAAPLGLPLAAVALAGGGAAALLHVAAMAAAREVRLSHVFRPEVPRRVNWGVLVLFVGLFVLVEGVRASGLLAAFLDAVAFARIETLPGLVVVTAVLSNLVSNVPAVLLLAPAAAPDRWLPLAAASTLAGNATLLGAAANVIVAEEARARGAEFDVLRFVLYGAPVAVATLALATWMLG